MSYSDAPATREGLIRSYNRIVGGIDEQAAYDDDRAYGGVIRAAKDKLVESMAYHIIRLAWQELGASQARLSFENTKTYRVPIQSNYIESLPIAVRDSIKSAQSDYFYRIQVDRHIFVDDVFVMGVECKSYTENAMLKRILVDFRLLKSLRPGLICCLLQLENMLGGDYSNPLASPQLGSASSHTLMSHSPEVNLNVITLLSGDRKVNRPIHNPDYFKQMRPEYLDRAISRFAQLLAPFA